jgi:hypothetical protein
VYLHCQDHGGRCDESHCAEALLDGFDGVLDLEEVAIGREDCDGCIVHLKYFQITIIHDHTSSTIDTSSPKLKVFITAWISLLSYGLNFWLSSMQRSRARSIVSFCLKDYFMYLLSSYLDIYSPLREGEDSLS